MTMTYIAMIDATVIDATLCCRIFGLAKKVLLSAPV